MEIFDQLEVQRYLRDGKTVENLEQEYGIGCNRHKQYPHLCQFKYDMISSPMGERIVQECRGIILDELAGWKVIARPFDKFFNYGEGHAAPIDWTTAKVQEKVDGSLMIVYYYEEAWHVASSGMPDARGDVNGFNFTFRELFWRTYKDQFGSNKFVGNPNYTYMFELTTPYNRVIVPHKNCSLTLIGVRETVTGIELDPALYVETFGYNWPTVRVFPLSSWDGIMESLKHIDPLQQEGYVVCDRNYNRVKLKHPGYVALAHLRDGMSGRRLLEIVRSGESSEFLTYFPEWEQPFNQVKERYETFASMLETEYEKYKGIENQKEFALAIKHVPLTAALFTVRAGRSPSIRHFLSEYRIENLAELLKIKEIEF